MICGTSIGDLFARSDRLYVKLYTQETNVRIYIVCDSSASMSYQGDAAWGSKLEVARTLAAALTWMLLRQNDAVGLLAQETEASGDILIRPSQKPSQFGLILQHLQAVVPAGGPCLAHLASASGASDPSPQHCVAVHGLVGAGRKSDRRHCRNCGSWGMSAWSFKHWIVTK